MPKLIWAWMAKYLPMRNPEYVLTDVVSGEEVFEWTQVDGRVCMATSRWSWFRVYTDTPLDDEHARYFQ